VAKAWQAARGLRLGKQRRAHFKPSLECAMAKSGDDDLFEGKLSGSHRTASKDSRALFPKGTGNKPTRRARAAWFTRKTGAGKVKLAHERPAGRQRVIVKARVVVHAKASGGAGGMMRHTLYVEREGASRDGERVQVFDRELDQADGAAFVDRCEGDRHHFRLIVSPEYGAQMGELKDYTRDMMERAEKDLGTSIDWIAAEHHDTGRPHVHLLIRGVREDGRDLVIPRAYVSHGFRDHAEELATERLGPRLEQGLSHDLDQRLERAAELERLTELDRTLRRLEREGELAIRDLPEEHRSGLVKRLNRLEDWGLAQRVTPGMWSLDPDLEDKLTRLADTRAREAATERILAREGRGLERDQVRELEDAHSRQRVTGRLVGFEPLTDDARGPCLIAIDGIDGKLWTARAARADDLRDLNGVERGAIVEIARDDIDIKPSDRTIWEIAEEHELVYSRDLHHEIRPNDRAKYIEMHERRLEALARDGIVERDRDGSFHVPADYLEQVLEREGRGGRLTISLEVHDPHSLAHQVGYEGPTWLDRVASGLEDKSQLNHEHGFGQEVTEAWKQRETTLRELDLGENIAGHFFPAEGWQEHLRAIEQDHILERVGRDTGRSVEIAIDGDHAHGLYTSRIHTAERSYAVLEHGRIATLVPWRAEMDRALNHYVAGQVHGRDFDFKYGRGVEKALGLGLDR
jgi:type IV secretory pathway VirD2 relaxase